MLGSLCANGNLVLTVLSVGKFSLRCFGLSTKFLDRAGERYLIFVELNEMDEEMFHAICIVNKRTGSDPCFLDRYSVILLQGSDNTIGMTASVIPIFCKYSGCCCNKALGIQSYMCMLHSPTFLGELSFGRAFTSRWGLFLNTTILHDLFTERMIEDWNANEVRVAQEWHEGYQRFVLEERRAGLVRLIAGDQHGVESDGPFFGLDRDFLQGRANTLFGLIPKELSAVRSQEKEEACRHLIFVLFLCLGNPLFLQLQRDQMQRMRKGLHLVRPKQLLPRVHSPSVLEHRTGRAQDRLRTAPLGMQSLPSQGCPLPLVRLYSEASRVPDL